MKNAEWDKLAERLRNDEDLRRRVIDVLKARGMSDDEAEARYDRVTQVAENGRTKGNRETG